MDELSPYAPELPPHAPAEEAPDTPARCARLLFRALAGLESPEAQRLLADAFDRFGEEDTCLRVIQPVMYRIGEEWAAGALPMSVEQFASYLMRASVAERFAACGETPGALGPVVTACGSGERHELGLMMLGLFLARRGVRVIQLGADLPIEDLVATVERMRPPVICLSATTEENARALLEAVRRLNALDGHRLRISCGGYAFHVHPELRAQADDFAPEGDVVQAADAIRDLLVPSTSTDQ